VADHGLDGEGAARKDQRGDEAGAARQGVISRISRRTQRVVNLSDSRADPRL
jgi:hypothetical protein